MASTMRGRCNGQKEDAWAAKPVEFRLMRPKEAADVSNLVLQVFAEDVAPDCDAQGVEAFARYVDPGALQQRSEHGYIVMVASVQDYIVGAIELREHEHISLLFVDPRYRGRGIARELLARALDLTRSRGHRVAKLTVNSSLYAVPFYESLGFCAKGPAQSRSGIRYTPMVLESMGSDTHLRIDTAERDRSGVGL